MRIFLTGDVHGEEGLPRFTEFTQALAGKLSFRDNFIVCGDFGILMDDREFDERFIKEEYGDFPIKILWVCGNHDNHERLKDYPVKDWCGGKVRVITNRIFHLMRGEVFTLPNGQSLLAMGGAQSINLGEDASDYWWPEEIPNEQERQNARDNLAKHGNKVDIIVTHDAPTSWLKRFEWAKNADLEYNDFLEEIKQTVDFGHWFFGHHHRDETDGKLTCLYESVVELTSDGIKTWVEKCS